jgi:hypothetical protein
MHNGQLSDPLNPWTKAIKAITSKHHTKKTEQDFEELIRLEWYGGLYLDENGAPCWPGENIEALVTAGAKKQRKGKEFAKGLLCEGNAPLIYDGPKEPDKLWALDPKFRKTGPCVVQGSRVQRTRPIFHVWELKFELLWEPEYFNLDDLQAAITSAGRDIGLSDWRPRYGRYEVLSMENGKG